MPSILTTVTFAEVPGFPAGSELAGILITAAGEIAGNTVTQTVAPGTASVSITIVESDTYTVSAVGVNAEGDTFGSAVVAAPITITVAPATISLSLPASVTVAAGP